MHLNLANEIHCPKCNSTQITANKKGFSAGKAAAGALLTGGIGLLAGAHGSGNIVITCLACGHKFKPGEDKIEQSFLTSGNKIELNNEADLDQLIVNEIKSNGLLSAVKTYKELTGMDLKESKERVDEIAKKYNARPDNKNNSGCAGVLAILAIVALTLIALVS